MKKYKVEILKWSNLFFLLPLVIAAGYNINWYVVVVSALLIVSFDFHFFREAKEVYFLDIFFSSLLMLSNFILLFLGHWKLPFSALAIILAIIALLFYFRKSKEDYYFNHSWWHIFSAGVCVFCLLTFLAF